MELFKYIYLSRKKERNKQTNKQTNRKHGTSEVKERRREQTRKEMEQNRTARQDPLRFLDLEQKRKEQEPLPSLGVTN